MSDRPDRQGALIGFAVLAPILYVLSVGPVSKLVDALAPNRHQAKKVLRVIYAPLVLVVEYGPHWAGEALEAYAKFWVKH